MTFITFPGLPPTPLFLSEAVACASPEAAASPAFANAAAPLALGQPAFCSAAMSLLAPKSPVAPSETSGFEWIIPAALGGLGLLTAGLVKFFGGRASGDVSVEPMAIESALLDGSMYLDATPAEGDVRPIQAVKGNNFELSWSEGGDSVIARESGTSNSVVLREGDFIRQGDRLFVLRTEGGLHFEAHSAYNFWEDVTIVPLRVSPDQIVASQACSPEIKLPLLKDLYVSARNESFAVPTDALEASEDAGYRIEQTVVEELDRSYEVREETMAEIEAVQSKIRTTIVSEAAQSKGAPGDTVKAKPLSTLTLSDLDFIGSPKTILETVPSIDVPPPTVRGIKAIPKTEILEIPKSTLKIE